MKSEFYKEKKNEAEIILMIKCDVSNSFAWQGCLFLMVLCMFCFPFKKEFCKNNKFGTNIHHATLSLYLFIRLGAAWLEKIGFLCNESVEIEVQKTLYFSAPSGKTESITVGDVVNARDILRLSSSKFLDYYPETIFQIIQD